MPKKTKNTNRNKMRVKEEVNKNVKKEEDIKVNVQKEGSFQEDIKDVNNKDGFENLFSRNNRGIFSSDELNLNLVSNAKLAELFSGFANMITHQTGEDEIKRMEEENLDFNDPKDIEKAKENVKIIKENIIDKMQFKTNNAEQTSAIINKFNEQTSAIINEFNKNMQNNKDIEKAKRNYDNIIKMAETLNNEAFLINHISNDLKFVRQCEDLIDNYINHGGVDVKNYTAKEVGEIPRDIQTYRAAFMFYVNNRENFSAKKKRNLEHKTGLFWLSAEERRENELLDYANNQIQNLRNIHSGVLFPCCCA